MGVESGACGELGSGRSWRRMRRPVRAGGAVRRGEWNVDVDGMWVGGLVARRRCSGGGGEPSSGSVRGFLPPVVEL